MRRVREYFEAAGYTVDGVAGLLGPVAHAALAREQIVPAERATRGGSPLETLVRVFLLGLTVPAKAAHPLLIETGLIERDGDEARALLDVRPYATDTDEWYVVSDLRRLPLPDDHVLGIGGASTTLASSTVRPLVGAALDIGTGCGVQALHLSTHASDVTGTDTNPRALKLAAMTAQLNGVELELLEGDLFNPVQGRRFDLVVSNPPFVIAPESRFTYRDSGRPGDEICRVLLAKASKHLTEDGWCQILANWEHHVGQDWRERVAGWVAGTECDAWALQREVQDPAEYAEMWLADAGEDNPNLYEDWLNDFAERGVEGIGFGIVTLRRTDAQPVLRLEEARQAVEHPLGPHIADWFARQDFLRMHDDVQILQTTFRVAHDAVLQQTVRLSDGEALTALRLSGGFRWDAPIDDVGAAVVAACDGGATLQTLLEQAATQTGVGLDLLRDGAVAAVRGLVERGFLHPA